MRILYYSPHPNLALNSPSGYGTHMREMIRAFRALGHTVHPVIRGGTDEAPTRQAAASPSLARRVKNTLKAITPATVWSSLKDFRLQQQDEVFEAELEREVASLKPDLIYERLNYLQPSGVRVANRLGIPHIAEVNAPYVEERQTLSGVHSWLEGRALAIEKEQLQRTDRVAIVSHTLQQYFQQQHSVPSDKFVVTPNAIDPAKVENTAASGDKLRQQYELQDAVVVGFVGSIFPWHGVDLLIQATERLLPVCPDLNLLIVGDGATLPNLVELRDTLGLEKVITFTGRVPHTDVFEHIACMDIAIMPASNWYGSPVKIFEYGAIGKAVIAPDNGPVGEVMTDGVDGLLVKPKIEALADAMHTLYHDAALRQQLASTFQDKVLTHHTWRHNAECIEEACISLATSDSA
jgi:glycosyltransferase involved in cell wall biosynthesis